MDALETSDYEPVDPRDGFLDMFSILTRWYSKDPFPIHKLERAFRRFSHPNTKETMDFIEKWIADMEDFIAIMSRTRDSDPQCYRSHFHLLQGFLDAGMVAAFSELPLLVKENSTDIGYRAVKVIKNMVEEIKDDRELGGSVRRMIRTGGFRKLSATLERSTILVRSVAVSCFREIYTRLGMGEDVSADTFGSWLHIFVGQFHQEKYKTLVEQWNEPNSLLKQELDRLYDNIEPANLEIQLRRWLQMNQHKALETALALFKTRTKPISRKYALEILQQNYSILRPLLDIVSEERPSWNITRETDSLAAKILMHLLRLSMDVIPNSELPLGCSDSEDKEEWNAAIACNTKLWSDGTALAALAKMRSKVLQEDIASLCRQLTGEVRDMSLKEQAYALNLNRGTLIVAQIRLLINATYLHNPTSAFLFALLPVAYKACERLPSALELQCDDLNEQYIMDSNSAIGGTEILSSSRPSVDQGHRMVNSYVAPITILGPTLLFRVLFRLSEMGLGLRTLQTLSITSERLFDIDGLELHLVHIHQITSSHIMGKLIRMSIGRRVPRQRELANKRLLGEGDRDDLEMEFCPFTFASAAELALAHLAFGSHAQNRGLPVIRDNQKTFVLAKKEVVICVGNAADAAGKVGQWALSKRFAKIAVDFCDSISRSEAKLIRFDVSSIKAKNQKRYTEASRQLN